MLLVALEEKALISSDVALEIVDLLKQSGSFMREAFKAANVATIVDSAKDGKGNAGLISDIDVCTKSSGAHYASVLLQINGQAFDKAALDVDKCF